MEAAIQRYETSLSDFYALVRQTSLEHNQTLSSNYIKTTSSVRVSQSIRTPPICMAGGPSTYLCAASAPQTP